jgi:hypothetical protein
VQPVVRTDVSNTAVARVIVRMSSRQALAGNEPG